MCLEIVEGSAFDGVNGQNCTCRITRSFDCSVSSSFYFPVRIFRLWFRACRFIVNKSLFSKRIESICVTASTVGITSDVNLHIIYCYLVVLSSHYFNSECIYHFHRNYYTAHNNDHFWIGWIREFVCAIYFTPPSTRIFCPGRIYEMKTILIQYNEIERDRSHGILRTTVWMDSIIFPNRCGLLTSEFIQLKWIDCLLFWETCMQNKTQQE